MPDPATVEGPIDKQQHAFLDAFTTLKLRIELFTSLPLDKLDRLALHAHMKSIGKK